MKQSLGAIIKDARKKQKLSQNALAIVINTTQQSVANWEKDKNKPDISILPILCQELNIDYNQIKKEYYDKKDISEKNIKIIKKILVTLIIVISITISIISVILIINRNKIYVYYASIDSDVVSMTDTLFIETNDEYILKLGAITSAVEEDCKILIYYENKDSKERKHIVHYDCSENPFVMQKKEDNIYFTKDFNINNKIYMHIYSESSNLSETYLLDFHKLYSYDKIFNSSLGAYY